MGTHQDCVKSTQGFLTSIHIGKTGRKLPATWAGEAGVVRLLRHLVAAFLPPAAPGSPRRRVFPATWAGGGVGRRGSVGRAGPAPAPRARQPHPCPADRGACPASPFPPHFCPDPGSLGFLVGGPFRAPAVNLSASRAFPSLRSTNLPQGRSGKLPSPAGPVLTAPPAGPPGFPRSPARLRTFSACPRPTPLTGDYIPG